MYGSRNKLPRKFLLRVPRHVTGYIFARFRPAKRDRFDVRLEQKLRNSGKRGTYSRAFPASREPSRRKLLISHRFERPARSGPNRRSRRCVWLRSLAHTCARGEGHGGCDSYWSDHVGGPWPPLLLRAARIIFKARGRREPTTFFLLKGRSGQLLRTLGDPCPTNGLRIRKQNKTRHY